MAGRKRRKKGRLLAWIVFLAAVAAIVAIAYFLHVERQRETRRLQAPPRKAAPARAVPAVAVPKAVPAEKDRAGRTVPKPRPEAAKAPLRVVIIIDDIGHELDPVRELLSLKTPITFAVLPDGARAAQAAAMIHGDGREVILHLPLEPRSETKANPGAMVLRTDMKDEEIRRQLVRDIRAVPHARGANSHMGSLFTENREKMVVVMKALHEKGFYFIDSRTSVRSRALEAARQTGVSFAKRDLFIDGRSEEEILQQILRLAGTADAAQPPVVIGHPYPGTIQALRNVIPMLRRHGIQVVSASEAVQPVGGDARAMR